VYRRTQFLLQKAEDRAHILEGYKIALNNLDDFVKIIRSSSNRDEAREKLMDKYALSERQANAILDMRLYQLTGLEREKIEEEYRQLMIIIEEYRSILASEQKLLTVIKSELNELKLKYESPRKTQIMGEEGEFRMEDVIANEGCIITVSHKGFIKRTPVSSYRSQRRGGKGVIGSGQHEEDFTEHLFTASTHDYIMFFMNNGRVYVEKVYEIPEGTRTSKGRSIVNVLQMQKDEKIAAMICVKEFEGEESLIMCTKKGIVKRTMLTEYQNYRKGGIIGIKIDDDDELIGCKLVKDADDVVLVTHHAMSIRFTINEDNVRAMGRATRGVKGITLKKADDFVEAIEVVDPNAALLIAGENGIGKRTSYDEYRVQSRGGSGIIATKTQGNVAGALSVREDDEIMMFTLGGQAVRSPVKDIRVIGRATQGVRLINLADGDTLVGISRIVEVEDDKADTEYEELADSEEISDSDES
jgi:DNA gyrase subunit A